MSDHRTMTCEELYQVFLDRHDEEVDDLSDKAFDAWVLQELESGSLVETDSGNYIFL